MEIKQSWFRIFGLFGILGGLMFFAGDLLFYFSPSSIDLKLNMANSSNNRIVLSGIVGLFATWFYVLGLVQVYFAFSPSKPIYRNVMIGSFAAILISYGVIHGAYVAIATSAKLALENNLDIEQAASLALETNNMMRLFIYPIFALMSYLFISEVWKKRTLYPRWIIVFFPLVTFLFKGAFANIPNNSLWIIINGGFLNLILVIFFAASTIALWNRK
ncbi:MAG: hypothetical protein DRI86_15625 [Bacteroidetes bacterium]|nr:MAG: hypothetical protein DRI86_15625 [Bacteroidota bacterium]